MVDRRSPTTSRSAARAASAARAPVPASRSSCRWSTWPRWARVGFGGAGPMHISRLADEFGIGTVVVPWAAGVASAVGLVRADIGAEFRQPFAVDLDVLDPTELDAAFRSLEQRARDELGAG